MALTAACRARRPPSSVTRPSGVPSSRRPAGRRRRPDELGQHFAQRGVGGESPGPSAGPGSSRLAARSSSDSSRRPGRRCRSAAPRTRRPDRARSAAGSAYCSRRPSLSTAIRSPRRNASSMSWVTRTIVVPKRRWIASRSSCALPRMIASRAPNGSSISSMFGSAASARATPTRCCWPPESWCGYFARELGRIELEQLEQLLDPRVDPGLRPAEQPRHGGDVLGHRPVREQAVPLDGVADAAAQLVLGHAAVSSPSISTRPADGLDQPVDHAQHRRLAGAGGADHDGDRAARDRPARRRRPRSRAS